MDSVLDFLKARRGRRIAVLTHQRPDGDALGSAVGLADILTRAGFSAFAVNPLPFPDYLAFVDPEGFVRMHPEADWHMHYDAAVVVDCGEITRLEEINRAAVGALPACTVDHHASSVAGPGEAAWIEPKASSTGEMIVRLADAAGWAISPAAARALWVAIVTDTGRFGYENTTAGCLAAARRCVECGAAPADAAARLYQSVSVAERKLQTKVLSRMELLEGGRLAVSHLTRADFEEAESGARDTQNLIALLRDTEGVEAAVFLYEPMAGEKAGEIKVSCRTRAPHNCLPLVVPLGGGGHERAAGCSLKGVTMDAAREAMIAAAARAFFRPH